MQEIGETTAEGQTFRIDTRLRPEGNQGPLARSLAGYTSYYEHYGLTWERQALSKARFVAGVGRARRALLRARRTRSSTTRRSPTTTRARVRRMKARIERERIPPGEDPQFHLKLGQGLAVRRRVHRAAAPAPARRRAPRAARPGDDRRARPAAIAPGSSTDDDAAALEAAYRFCERARNALYLQTGAAVGLAADRPRRRREARPAARLRASAPRASLRDDYRRVTRRARRVVEHVFYGLEPS